MPQIKVLRGSEHITVDTDQVISTTDAALKTLLEVLAKVRSTITALTDIEVLRIDIGGIFTHEIKTSNGRVYAQHWYFDGPEPLVSYDTATTGKWAIPELLSNIGLRDAVRDVHALVGMQHLVCKW